MKTTLYNPKNSRFIKIIVISTYLFISMVACQGSKTSNLVLLDNQIPRDTALVFAPNIISMEHAHESSINFNSDMTELFFHRALPKEKVKIYIMKLIDGTW